MGYNNSEYWKGIHNSYGNSLKTVGISSLSNHYNVLKYNSESSSFLSLLPQFNKEESPKLEILDIGAGTGYWSGLMHRHYDQLGIQTKITALDVSQTALNSIKENNPHFDVVCADLKIIDTDMHKEKFDIVTACYCLHHITNINGFINGLVFAAKSVKPGGTLIIMDPMLEKPFSLFYKIDNTVYEGWSLPRSLYIIENIIADYGLKRTAKINAISFLLGGNVESNTKIGYKLQQKIWYSLYRFVYKKESMPTFLENIILRLDYLFKRSSHSNSSIICKYTKI